MYLLVQVHQICTLIGQPLPAHVHPEFFNIGRQHHHITARSVSYICWLMYPIHSCNLPIMLHMIFSETPIFWVLSIKGSLVDGIHT